MHLKDPMLAYSIMPMMERCARRWSWGILPVKAASWSLVSILLLAAVCCVGQSGPVANDTALPFEIYDGYFVSNRFEPDSSESFVIILDQELFDRSFGAAFVMKDKSHRLPRDIFNSNIILAAIKRGNAVWKYKVESVMVKRGVVELRYATSMSPSDSATFACPLIVSVPRGLYVAVQFIDNGKLARQVEIGQSEGGNIKR